MKIHPTALIDNTANLADDVEVGPWALIGPRVSLGSGCRVLARATLESDVTAGPDNLFGYGSIVGAAPQDLSYKEDTPACVRIGEGNTFREYTTIHRGTGAGTIVGNENYIMAGAHLGHNVSLGNHVIIANNCLLAGHVTVGDRAFLGGASVFHQFMRVGRLAITQGVGKFGKDLPPFCLGAGLNQVAGVNLVGLKRAGISIEERQDIRRAFDLLYRSGQNTSQALAEAASLSWSPPAREFFEFVGTATKRGICRLAGTRSGVADDE